MTGPTRYVGRFAPSPSGPLHFGSLLAAVASYLQACCAAGRWLVRIEDIDPPREQPGADTLILRVLEAFGFRWHGPVDYQSRHRERHLRIIDRLLSEGHAYRCGCSRRDLVGAPLGPLGPVYPGTCRDGTRARDAAIRVRTDNRPIQFNDGLQGPHMQRLETESGDFIIHRRDGLVAYHLAVVVDDAHDGITEVVRGIDLLDSTPRQIHLQRLLRLPTPSYLHIPVAVNAAGQKLGKRTGAPGLDPGDPRPTLVAAFRALELPARADLAASTLDDIWAWAVAHWALRALHGRKQIVQFPDALAGRENGLS